MNMCMDKFATAGERRIARAIVRAALDSGFLLSVHDGEEITVNKSGDRMKILAALATTGEDNLYFYEPTTGEAVTYYGRVYLVWGNDPTGCELVADMGAPTEAGLAMLEAFIERATA